MNSRSPESSRSAASAIAFDTPSAVASEARIVCASSPGAVSQVVHVLGVELAGHERAVPPLVVGGIDVVEADVDADPVGMCAPLS